PMDVDAFTGVLSVGDQLVNVGDRRIHGVNVRSQVFGVSARILVRAAWPKVVVTAIPIVVVHKVYRVGAAGEQIAGRPGRWRVVCRTSNEGIHSDGDGVEASDECFDGHVRV